MALEKVQSDALIASGFAFLEGASVLERAKPGIHDRTIYVLLFYAMENTFKGYLSFHGQNPKDLKSLGHKLRKLNTRAKELGLAGGERFDEFVRQIDHKLNALRYLEGEPIVLAEPSEAVELVRQFIERAALILRDRIAWPHSEQIK